MIYIVGIYRMALIESTQKRINNIDHNSK
jgi:hypothetical protein